MSTTPTTGSAANCASAASLALPAFTLTAGQDVVVGVALGYTGSEAVTSITDDAGNTYALKSAVNGTGVRTEEWQAQNVAARTNNVITIHVSPNTDIAGAAEEYAGTFNSAYSQLSQSGWSIKAVESEQAGHEGSKTIDGNVATNWYSNNGGASWIAYDFGSAQTFRYIATTNRNDNGWGCPKACDVYVSDDGTTWGASIYSFVGAGVQSAKEIWDLGSSYTHRYLKLVINTSYLGGDVVMAEFNIGSYATVPSQNTGSNSGSNTYPYQKVTTQCGNNFQVTAIGFAAHSGDTLTAQLGTSRQSSIPAATRSGVALYDNTMVGDGQVVVETRISTARNWATAGLELQVSGGVAVTYVDYAATTAPALQVAKDVRYLRLLMPLGGGGSITPPSGEGQFWPPPIAKQGS